jgi:DNA-directed RNA polymerase subunit RPC12/RpoP
MNESARHVIDDSRNANEYVCAKCEYVLDGVPMSELGQIACPECGYEMRFQIRVQLIPVDPDYDREVRKSLKKIERVVTRVTFVLILIIIAATIWVVMT